MNWSDIPSLAALRAFEAAARHGSMSAAARELNVTHAAVAQHLRTLEKHFGTSLMRRSGRGMVLTDAGQTLFLPLRNGFGEIASGVRRVMAESEDGPVNLSVTPAFAETWLMPRLSMFWQKHPEITLSIQPSFELVDLSRDNIDMAIRFGRGTWQGHDITFLTNANYVVIAAPDVATKLADKGLPGLAGQTFLFEPGYPEAKRWIETQGLTIPDDDIVQLPTFSMVLSAVRDGLGLSILSAPIVERDLADGALEALYTSSDKEVGYWILTKKDRVSARLNTLRRWLVSVA